MVYPKEKGSHFSYANSYFAFSDENGRTQYYKACDVCGCWCKSNSGAIFNYNANGDMCFAGIGLCRRCATQFSPIFREFLEKVENKRNEIRNSEEAENRRNSEENQKIENKWREGVKRINEWTLETIEEDK